MRSAKNIITSLILVAVTTFCIIFLLQNGDLVRVNLFHLSTPEKPLWMFVLGAFVCGLLAATLISLIYSLKQSSIIRKHKKQNKLLEQELHQLRNQPLEDLPEDNPVEVATLVDQTTHP